MKYFLLIIISLGCMNLTAQHREQDKVSGEKIEARKIAYFSLKLNFTPEEAQVFWPVYNEYSKQKKELRQNIMPLRNLDKIDDSKANELIKAHFENKEHSLALENEYVEKFKEILPAKKVLHLMILERKFKEEVLKDLKRRLDNKK